MAVTCTSTALIDATRCQECQIPPGMIPYVKLAILCNIVNGVTMTCDSATLIEAAKCFECQIPLGFVPYIEVYLLCQIASGSSGSGGGITCGVVNPSAAPSGSCAIYYRTDTLQMWFWDGAAWQIVIA